MNDKTLSPYINTDVKMSKKMLNALNLHETISVVTGVKAVSESDVRTFLARRYGEKFAAKFKPEFLFIARADGDP